MDFRNPPCPEKPSQNHLSRSKIGNTKLFTYKKHSLKPIRLRQSHLDAFIRTKPIHPIKTLDKPPKNSQSQYLPKKVFNQTPKNKAPKNCIVKTKSSENLIFQEIDRKITIPDIVIRKTPNRPSNKIVKEKQKTKQESTAYPVVSPSLSFSVKMKGSKQFKGYKVQESSDFGVMFKRANKADFKLTRCISSTILKRLKPLV